MYTIVTMINGIIKKKKIRIKYEWEKVVFFKVLMK